jgi:hypothetical protein
MNAVANLLPGVPIIESPFFDELVAGTNFDEDSRNIARDLNTKGYSIIDFPDPEFGEVAEAIKRNLHPRYDWKKYSEGQSLRIQEAWTFDENVKRLATNQRIIHLLSTIYGRQANAHFKL